MAASSFPLLPSIPSSLCEAPGHSASLRPSPPDPPFPLHSLHLPNRRLIPNNHFPLRPFFAVSFRFPSKIRRKSDPAFFWRNAANLAMSSGSQTQSSVETSTEQLIRKWSTKSNSSGAEQLRTLREQLGDGKRSAGNVAKGRSSSSSCSSRPHLPFLVQQSDSAIGSSLDGSFSFLPPPPPYRPPRPASGSDGAIGTQQRQQVPRGQDFTSLLGFDLVKPTGQMGPNGEEETQQKRTNEKKGEMAGTIRMARQGTEKRNSGEGEGAGGGGAAGTTTGSKPVPKREKPVAAAAALALAFRASQASSQVSLLSPSPSAMSFSEYPELQEKVQKLQASRENLNLQVAVLSQQVSLQREKIRDLESLLESSRRNSRESIPGLAQELAELQHKYLALERDKLEAERRLRLSNSELERISEQAALPPPSNGQQPPQPPKHHLQQQPLQNGLGNGGGVSRAEMDRLQMAIQRLMADNEQKDSMIQSLRIALDEQQRRLTHQANGSLEEHFSGGQPHSFDINDQIRRLLLEEDAFGPSGHPMAHSSSFPLALCSSQSPAGLPPAPGTAPIRHQNILPSSNSFSSALAHQQAFAAPPPLWRVTSPPAIPPHLGQSPRTPASPLARQLAAELDELRRSGTVASGGLGLQPQQMHSNQQQQQPYSSASLPRSIHSKSNSLGAVPNPSKHSNSSIPPTHFESDDECGSRSSAFAAASQSNGGQSNGNKNFKRGRRARSTFRSFLDRFAHRGNSMQDLRPSPRPSPAPSSISASGPIPLRPPIRQLVDWDQQKCARWLAELGFQDCAFAVIRSGRHLLNMNEGELERELGIRSALQRKRLRGILGRMERGGDFEPADRMDTNQVMLWLDLIGLPQYRDLFADCRMNGHLLLALSAQDLLELGIHSALNHASLARGIQFLRSAEFHLHRLERHFHQDFLGHSPIPAEVEHWSHGCTLEWLCNVDLAEFTPNLVFSGLHGALMVLEPTFTAESLAGMLQIPPQKTLLRRHLTSQFNSLLGQQVVSHKRDVLGQPFVTHLTPSLRIRLAKKGFSLTRKKSKSDIFVEPEVRVCPEETNGEEMSEV